MKVEKFPPGHPTISEKQKAFNEWLSNKTNCTVEGFYKLNTVFQREIINKYEEETGVSLTKE